MARLMLPFPLLELMFCNLITVRAITSLELESLEPLDLWTHDLPSIHPETEAKWSCRNLQAGALSDKPDLFSLGNMSIRYINVERDENIINK